MAVVSGRFVPIVRTFVPFVAGAAAMTPATFVFYNIIGAVIWVTVCAGAGYIFGNVPIIKENFSLVAIGIVFVSVIPIAIEMLRQRKGSIGSRSSRGSRGFVLLGSGCDVIARANRSSSPRASVT